MSGAWTIWLDDPLGHHLAVLDKVGGASLVKVANGVGSLTLSLPTTYDSLLKPDGIIEIWRKTQTGALKFVNAYFIVNYGLSGDQNRDTTVVTALDGNYLLTSRIIAYAAGLWETSKTDYADDMMKAIVNENLGDWSLAVAYGRSLTAYGFTVAGDLSAAPRLSLQFSYRKLLDVLYDIANSSNASGTPLYFDVVAVPGISSMGWEFRTYINQPGQDLTDNNHHLVFGREMGNLDTPNLAYEWKDEKNYVYVAGKGNGGYRRIVQVTDATWTGASPWRRREMFLNASGQIETTAGLTDAGNTELYKNRPRFYGTGRVLDTEQSRYQIDWNWGDKVIVSYRGNQYAATITTVQLSLDGMGRETIFGVYEISPDLVIGGA